MSVASFTMIALLGLAPAADPSGLVEQLGSARYAEREQAATALRGLGVAALPALRTARSARDAEVRTRAAAILDHVESEQMVRPTLVDLDFQDGALPDVVKAIGERSQVNLVLQPEGNPEIWKGRKVTLKEDAPVPFWAAIDRLCAAGQLRHDQTSPTGLPVGRLPSMNLSMGGPQPTGPTVDSGPFRIVLFSVTHNREVLLQAGVRPVQALRKKPMPAALAAPIQTNVNEQFFFQMQVIAEPRLFLSQGGPLKLTEAADDKGQSLLLPSNDNQANQMVNQGYLNPNRPQPIQLVGQLKYAEKPGKTIKTLKGSLPMSVAARKDNPLVIHLAGAAGKTFRTEEATLIYHETKPDPNGQGPLVELTLRNHGGAYLGPNARAEMMAMHTMIAPQNQLEVLDAQGKVLPYYNRNTSGQPGDTRLSLAIMNNGDGGAPATVRYYDLTRATTEAIFEYHDIPMP